MPYAWYDGTIRCYGSFGSEVGHAVSGTAIGYAGTPCVVLWSGMVLLSLRTTLGYGATELCSTEIGRGSTCWLWGYGVICTEVR
eukprot:1243565-Rhodomonas_salina.1